MCWWDTGTVPTIYMIDIDSLNKSLRRQYRVQDGRPIYRIVFSDGEFEHRRASSGGIALVKKYWYIKPPCWVLEKLTFVDDKEILEELVEIANGSYEPLYVFRDNEGNPLPVLEAIVERILYILHNPTKILPSDIEDARLAQEKEELKYFEEEVGKGERSPLFIFENSVFVSTNQMKFKKDK